MYQATSFSPKHYGLGYVEWGLQLELNKGKMHSLDVVGFLI
jgi:hypothetical protein